VVGSVDRTQFRELLQSTEVPDLPNLAVSKLCVVVLWIEPSSGCCNRGKVPELPNLAVLRLIPSSSLHQRHTLPKSLTKIAKRRTKEVKRRAKRAKRKEIVASVDRTQYLQIGIR
jgi:hypothetical protein